MLKRSTYKCTPVTKEKLIAATVRVVKAKGYENVTIRDICQESGVSNGAFYHHFGSKEALVKEAYLSFDRTITDSFVEQLNGMPPLDALSRILKSQLDYIVGEIGMIVTEYYKILLNGENVSLFDPDRAFYQVVMKQVRRCLMCGIFDRRYEETQLTSYIMKFLRSCVVDWCIHGGAYALADHFFCEFNMLVSGISS